MSTHDIPLAMSIRKSLEIITDTIMYAAMGFLLGTQERVRNSRRK